MLMKIFITGANRGIGLELARQYLQRGDNVYAACRTPDQASELNQLQDQHSDRLTILQLEVANDDHIEAVGEKLEQITDSLDILINNAGVSIGRDDNFENLTSKNLLDVFRINSVAPVMIAQRLLSLLRKGNNPKLINISSQLGSLERKRSGGRYSYNASKAALNMFSRALAFDLRSDGIITIMIHPGWVQTDMGGGGAPLTVQESAEGLINTINNLTVNDLGHFLQWDGSELPW